MTVLTRNVKPSFHDKIFQNTVCLSPYSIAEQLNRLKMILTRCCWWQGLEEWMNKEILWKNIKKNIKISIQKYYHATSIDQLCLNCKSKDYPLLDISDQSDFLAPDKTLFFIQSIGIFLTSCWKCMLWAFIKNMCLTKMLLMSTHNVRFHGEIRKTFNRISMKCSIRHTAHFCF